VPRATADLEQRHRSAHASLAAAHRSAAADARTAFAFLQHRLLVESLAYVQPVLVRPLEQLLRPPPRAFLTRTQQLRLMGAGAAFRHLDSRVTMFRAGWVPSVVHATTPIALHALLEGSIPSGRETNAGMMRVTPTSWRPEANAFEHPPADACEQLVAEAIGVANGTGTGASAGGRAAWLTFTLLSIHPFVDGNGRTSRALFLGVAAEDLELGVDWGIVEQWSVARYHYVEALQAGQRADRYDGDLIDAAPFVEFSAEASIVGADLCRQRLEMFEAELVGLHQLGLSAAAALVLVAVRTDVFLGTDDLGPLGLHAAEIDAAIDELGARGLVSWAQRPASRRTMAATSSHGLVSPGP